jgi:multiple sugar transport system permease protein
MTRASAALLSYALLVAGAIVMAAPFAWMLSTALKTGGAVFLLPPRWLPSPPHWENFARAVSVVPFFRGVRNTLLIVLPPLLVGTFACALAAYSFARLRFPGRDLLFGGLLLTMMIPGAVTMVPLFILFRELRWLDTFRPLVVPGLFGGAYGIFLLRQFFLALPAELEDAARVDGCNPLQRFLFVALPLCKPALATLFIFGFVGGWNEFMGPLIYLNSAEKFPLQLVLSEFRTLYYTDWTLMMAGSFLASLPLILLFLLCQRAFIQGIALTGMKS